MSDADLLRSRLRRVAQRERLVLVAAACCRLGLAVVVLVAGFFVIDWLLVSRVVEQTGTDRAMRGLLLAVMLITLLALAARSLLPAIRRPLDDDTIALRVESRHGALGGRLISTVQLTRSGQAISGSAELIAALEADTVSFASALDFSDIINSALLRRTAVAVGVVGLCATAMALWQGELSRALFDRLLMGDARYPTASHITSLTPGGRVPRGENFTVTVRVEGELPETCQLRVTAAGSDENLTMNRLPDSGTTNSAQYQVVIPRVLGDMRYRVTAGDTRSDWQQVHVLLRPVIAEVDLTISAPAYAALPSRTQVQGDVEALHGSTVSFRVNSSKPLATATLRVSVGEQISELPVKLAADHHNASGSFTIAGSGTWQVLLRDQDNLSSENPPLWRITAQADQAPSAELLWPAADKTASPTARWPLRLRLRDDLGLGGAALCYRIDDLFAEGAPNANADTPAAAPAKRIELPLGDSVSGPGTRELTINATFDLALAAAAPGQRLSYWVEVRDRRETPGIGRSKTYAFNVIDAAALREQLDRERDQALRRLHELRDRQGEARDQVDDLRGRLRRGEDPSGSSPQPAPPPAPAPAPAPAPTGP